MHATGFGGDPVRAGRRRRAAQRREVSRLVAGGALHDRGSAAAEFAVAIPVVVLVLACCLGAIQVASQQVRLTDAAADAARTLARGDPPGVAAARVQRVASSAAMSTSTSGDFVCVQLSAPAGFGPAALAGLQVRASGCALAGGL
ncbi:TadE family type IV pilus minor pilin [Mycetocola sp.]|uniref:TadE family type IV pilus minor pilin n=1 Tax=Mycetocola sp. TaxID=1871042 RepID=UPI003989DD02